MIYFKNLKLSEKINNKKKEVAVKDENISTSPIVDFNCPKCGNKKAYFESYQFSRSDEGMTNFLRCTKCGHTVKFR